MNTTTKARHKVKPVEPVSGSCLWLRNLVIGSGQPGLVLIDNGKGLRTTYTVCAIEDRLKVLGYRLTKVRTAEEIEARAEAKTYDLDTTAEHMTCECGDFLYRRSGKDEKGCKHCCSIRAGLRQKKILWLI